MLEPLQAQCPVCGSDAVVYSCSPTCCFNHVCAECRASWQQGTELLATAPPAGIVPPASAESGGESYTPCARCSDPVLRLSGTDDLYCPNCRVLLRLRCTAVQPFVNPT